MLIPCSSCRRHVRAASTSCPFCDAPFAARRAPRASALAGALAAGALVAGCGTATSSPSQGPTEQAQGVEREAPAYGGAPMPNAEPEPLVPQAVAPEANAVEAAPEAHADEAAADEAAADEASAEEAPTEEATPAPRVRRRRPERPERENVPLYGGPF